MTHRCVSCNHDPLYLLFRYLFFLKELPDQFLKILPDTPLYLPLFSTIRCRNSRKHIRTISSLVINGYGSLAVCFCFQIHKQCRQSRCSDVDADSIKCIFCFLCRSFCCIFQNFFCSLILPLRKDFYRFFQFRNFNFVFFRWI